MACDMKAISLIGELEKLLSLEDVSLMKQFLSHEEVGLALEYICDKLIENGTIIPESLARKILIASSNLGLKPDKTWETIIVEEENSHQLRRLFREGPDLYTPMIQIVNELKNELPQADADQIAEFFEHNELDLGVDLLCSCLIQERIPICKRILDKIRVVLLDSDRDPEMWKGFVIKEG